MDWLKRIGASIREAIANAVYLPRIQRDKEYVKRKICFEILLEFYEFLCEYVPLVFRLK